MTETKQDHIDFAALKQFMVSLSGHIPDERISDLTRRIGDALRYAGVRHERLGNAPLFVITGVEATGEVIDSPSERLSGEQLVQAVTATPAQLEGTGLEGVDFRYRPGGLMDQLFEQSGKGRGDD